MADDVLQPAPRSTVATLKNPNIDAQVDENKQPYTDAGLMTKVPSAPAAPTGAPMKLDRIPAQARSNPENSNPSLVDRVTAFMHNRNPYVKD